MAIDQAIDWFMGLVGWRWHDYGLHLLACLVFWLLLYFLTPVNRVAAFVFSFSAWFALHWTLALVYILYRYPLDLPGALFLCVIPLTFFGYCALSSPFYFGSAYEVDVDAARLIRWGWFLLPAHLYHFLWLIAVEASLPPATGG
ncbi:MAG: hypothetical protein GC190_21140 [Alphaproteobacteria bacterium]|nr:hypothetical protein [Alphaproteobacteria bacterium]